MALTGQAEGICNANPSQGRRKPFSIPNLKHEQNPFPNTKRRTKTILFAA
jgi:hypothetical protein